MRAAHQLQGCIDVSPGLSFLPLTLFLAVAGLLSGLDDCRIAVRLQQLSRVIVDFHFFDSHDAVLLSFDRQTQGSRLKRLDVVIEKELVRMRTQPNFIDFARSFVVYIDLHRILCEHISLEQKVMIGFECIKRLIERSRG